MQSLYFAVPFAVSKPANNFWMETAYRLPKDRLNAKQFNSQVSETTVPITDIVVNSLGTNLTDWQMITGVNPVEIKRLAWNGGDGITVVWRFPPMQGIACGGG